LQGAEKRSQAGTKDLMLRWSSSYTSGALASSQAAMDTERLGKYWLQLLCTLRMRQRDLIVLCTDEEGRVVVRSWPLLEVSLLWQVFVCA
jgi:hypothetical protein